jgi:rifampicin phosphotransferase
MPAFTMPLSDLDRASLELVGGKGANLGELRRAGVPVPDGFCLTTQAFRRFVHAADGLEKFYVRLEQLNVDDLSAVTQLANELRAGLDELPMPADVCSELLGAWQRLGEGGAYAVRSSATAEDLADASFAGQYDTCLNVRSEKQLLDAVRQCWLSLFTDRAIIYRARHGFDHRQVELAIVVQRMVLPDVAGVMFTADPVSGHRKTVVVNAAYGLGEAVVSGVVSPDLYQIDKDGNLHTTIADKKQTIVPLPSGGTELRDVPEPRQKEQALPDATIQELAAMGRRIQQHFGSPQDIEWAWAEGELQILQSRPITSLFPTPEPDPDGRLHIYFSFGHQQMMTDAIKPLGLSALRTYFPFGRRKPNKETTQMAVAGGRIYIDYTNPVHSWLARKTLIRAAGTMNKPMGDALLKMAGRADFQANHRFDLRRAAAMTSVILRSLAKVVADLCWKNLDAKEPKVNAFMEERLARSQAAMKRADVANPIERIQIDMRETSIHAFYQITSSQFSAMAARVLIERWCRRWLDDVSQIPAFEKSLPGNVTTEMGLAIGDLADLARDNPELLAFLQSPPEPFSLEKLDAVRAGTAFREALERFLDQYGMRCPGEIDLTRERWSDNPALLFPGVLANVRTGKAGEHRERFLAGEREAEKAIQDVADRLRTTRFGRLKAAAMVRVVKVYRVSMGLREHQKFLNVWLWDAYRRLVRETAVSLTNKGVLAAPEDAHFLSLDELRKVVEGSGPSDLTGLIERRRAEHAANNSLKPPRLFTSDGEIVSGGPPPGQGKDKAGVLTGLPVSSGVVEGRARVVLRPENAHLEEGDILVAPYTDPGWTPLFSAVRGVVLEIGGLMTHGAVVARELGLPTVVGIDDATKLIPDGTRIRVDGSRGVVETLKS